MLLNFSRRFVGFQSTKNANQNLNMAHPNMHVSQHNQIKYCCPELHKKRRLKSAYVLFCFKICTHVSEMMTI